MGSENYFSVNVPPFGIIHVVRCVLGFVGGRGYYYYCCYYYYYCYYYYTILHYPYITSLRLAEPLERAFFSSASDSAFFVDAVSRAMGASASGALRGSAGWAGVPQWLGSGAAARTPQGV